MPSCTTKVDGAIGREVRHQIVALIHVVSSTTSLPIFGGQDYMGWSPALQAGKSAGFNSPVLHQVCEVICGNS